MKKTFTLFCSLLCAGSIVQAQQIQGDFDKQTPWVDGKGTTVQGWDVLNVIQMGMMKYPLTFSDADHDPNNPEGKSVRMECQFLGLSGMGSNSPSYMTLGKTWVYADIAGVMSQSNGDKSDPDDSDGGSYGGIKFAHRPDSITGFFKRTLGEEKPDEVAKIIVYSWKGTTSSDAPANTGSFADMSMKTEDAPRQTLVDRDIDILGKKTGKPAEGITLVSNTEYDIKGALSEWTPITIPINYLSDDTPEKMNVILSASNYYDRSQIGNGNKLWADNVRFIYNAKLKSITLDGKELPNFNEDVFEYVLPASEQQKELKATAWGQQANVQITQEGNQAIIKVTDETAKGEKSYTYKITFHGEATVINLPENAPEVFYGDSLVNLGFASNNTSDFEYEFSEPGILKVENGKIVALKPGNVLVTAKQGQDENHANGQSEPLEISVQKAPLTLRIKDGATCQRGVSASTKDKVEYELELIGLKLNDSEKETSEILSTMPKLKGDAPKDQEFVGDQRTVTLSGAVSENYEIDQSGEFAMTVVPNVIDVYVDYAGGGRFNSEQTGENYHTLKVAAGQDEYIFSLSYFYAAYNDKDVLEKDQLIQYLQCAVNKDAAVGEEFPVSMALPEKDYEQFKLNLLMPDDAKIVLAENPSITYFDTDSKTITYGDEPFTLANCENKITYKITNSTTDLISVDRNCLASIKNAGTADIIIGSAAKDNFGATAKRLSFEINKADLTIKAADDTIKAGEAIPEVFKLEYKGFVYTDTVSNVFQTEPKAYINESGILEAGSYPILIQNDENPVNYNVKLIPGQLLVTAPTGIINPTQNQGIYYNEGKIINPNGGKITIYTVAGNQIGTYSGTNISVLLTPNMIYLVKTDKGVQKLLVK